MIEKRLCTILLLATFAVLTVGCGGNSDFGQVTGTVTVDGTPVPEGMKISFEPNASGKRASTGVTRTDGSYEIWNTRDQRGAYVGKHLVRLYIDRVMATEELRKVEIPPEFGVDSTFIVEVEPGSQVVDIPITSQ